MGDVLSYPSTLCRKGRVAVDAIREWITICNHRGLSGAQEIDSASSTYPLVKSLATELKRSVILDGEIVCLGREGEVPLLRASVRTQPASLRRLRLAALNPCVHCRLPKGKKHAKQWHSYPA